MKSTRRADLAHLLAALNRDIAREIRMADDCLRRAGSLARPHIHVEALLARCAAAALSNATALASEALALGGMPRPGLTRPTRASSGACCMTQYVLEARTLVARYRRRLALAERLGLPRLAATLRDIIGGKRAHLAHAALVAAADATPRLWN